MKPKYRRVLLKLSGEALLPAGATYGVSIETAGAIAAEVKAVLSLGVEIAIVIGGGNIFRGAQVAKEGMVGQAHADTMGMIATVVNGLALQEAFRQSGVDACLMTSIAMPSVTESFTRQAALRYLDSGNVLIISGGTGRPFFSTDTAAVLAALETGAEVVLKATKVDGVYSADPIKDPVAKRFDKISCIEAIKRQLKVMDSTAMTMCMDYKLPIIVFDFFRPGNLKKVVMGQKVGTVLYG